VTTPAAGASGRGEAAAPPAGVTEGTSPGALPASGSAARDKPAVPDEVTEVFLPASRASTGAVTYAPALVARVSVRFVDPKTKLDYAREGTFTTPLEEGALGPDWTRARWSPLRAQDLTREPVQDARFCPLPKEATKPKSYAGWQRALVSWLAESQGVARPYSPKWKVYGEPGESEGAFRGRLELRAREEREAALEALNAKYSAKFEALREKLQRAHAAVVRDEAEARVQGVGSAFSVGAQVMSLFGARSPGRRILGGAAQVTRQAGRLSRARDALEEKRRALTELQAKGQALDAEYRAEAARVTSATASIEIESALVRPKKTHIEVRLFALGWCPVE